MKINWLKTRDFKDSRLIIKNILAYGFSNLFINFLILLKQGFDCKDCNKTVNDCLCNWCETCNKRLCMCSYDFENNYEIDYLIKWMKYNLSKNNYKRIQQDLMKISDHNPAFEHILVYSIEHL